MDALVTYDFTPAFIYPLRMIGEAKADDTKVGIDVIRNADGVVKEVNENYFTHKSTQGQEYKIRRFNYAYAVFSLNGFSKNAQRYAIAHQIFLIQYYYTPLFNRIRELLTQINKQNSQVYFRNLDSFNFWNFRKKMKEFLKTGEDTILGDYMTGDGAHLMHELRNELENIGGSYFGLLNGEYPIHILSERPIQRVGEDTIRAEVYVTRSGLEQDNMYVEIKFGNNRLFFELPEDIARIFSEVWGKKRGVANLKRKYVSFITLSGKIDGIRRNIIIELDKDWLEEYLRRTF